MEYREVDEMYRVTCVPWKTGSRGKGTEVRRYLRRRKADGLKGCISMNEQLSGFRGFTAVTRLVSWNETVERCWKSFQKVTA